MSVKSWINSPIPEDGNQASGLVQIQGVAFGGMNAVKGWKSPSTAARPGSRPA
jgi:sulfite dehydrogenase